MFLYDDVPNFASHLCVWIYVFLLNHLTNTLMQDLPETTKNYFGFPLISGNTETFFFSKVKVYISIRSEQTEVKSEFAPEVVSSLG